MTSQQHTFLSNRIEHNGLTGLWVSTMSLEQSSSLALNL